MKNHIMIVIRLASGYVSFLFIYFDSLRHNNFQSCHFACLYTELYHNAIVSCYFVNHCQRLLNLLDH